MPFTPYIDKALLDWALNGATPTRPPGLFVQFATASPTTQSAFDGPFTARNTVTMAAANSPAGAASATNLNAITGLATAAATALGWNLYDSAAGGTRLAFGTLSANIGCKSADNPSFAAGALTIVLS